MIIKKVTPITFLFERVARTSSHGVYFAACSRLNLFQYSAKFQTEGIQVKVANFISHFVPIDLSDICNDVYLDNRHRSKGKIYVSV